jgi:hypothetical protein
MKLTRPQRHALTILAAHPDGMTATNLGMQLAPGARKSQGFALAGGTMGNRLAGMKLARRVHSYATGVRRAVPVFQITAAGRIALGSAAPQKDETPDLLSQP